MKQIVTIAAVLMISFIACRQRYNPPVISAPQSFLVVEGNLTIGGPTSIRLTKTFKLADTAKLQTVNGALLKVEGKDNSVQSISSAANGYYTSPGLNILPGNEYRLRIQTTDGKEFLSDYVVAKATPPIDSISWEKNGDRVTIFANTHDPSNTTKYYRWDYTETWEYRSPYGPSIIYANGMIRDRIFPQENVTNCWTTLSSSNILLANSIRLQSDIISKATLKVVPVGNDRITVRYSILVRQYALGKQAYNFYELLKDNTENIGSFFAPLPSQVSGNLHCISNPAELVIGFVTASSISEKRIFISAAEVTPWPYNYNCEETRVRYNIDSVRAAIQLGLLPVVDLGNPPGQYIFSTPVCVDCRIKGGNTTRPSFW